MDGAGGGDDGSVLRGILDFWGLVFASVCLLRSKKCARKRDCWLRDVTSDDMQFACTTAKVLHCIAASGRVD